jgi:adenylate kinase
MIEKLQGETPKKFFLMGAPGTFRAENANALKDEFNKQSKKGDDWRAIHTGELLKRTAEKKTELGNKIKSSMVANQYVEDELVIEVVQGAIKECEEAKKSWILQGYPRTKVQALAL